MIKNTNITKSTSVHMTGVYEDDGLDYPFTVTCKIQNYTIEELIITWEELAPLHLSTAEVKIQEYVADRC